MRPAILIGGLCAITAASGRGRNVNDQEWLLYEMTVEMRKKGHTCTSGRVFAPNSKPISFDCKLFDASVGHSKDMAERGYFSHNNPEGERPSDRAKKAGFRMSPRSGGSGENIAAGSSDAKSTLNQWLESPGHCHGLFNPYWNRMSLGRYEKSGSMYRSYWTQMFATTPYEADTSCYPSGSGGGDRRHRHLLVVQLHPLEEDLLRPQQLLPRVPPAPTSRGTAEIAHITKAGGTAGRVTNTTTTWQTRSARKPAEHVRPERQLQRPLPLQRQRRRQERYHHRLRNLR